MSSRNIIPLILYPVSTGYVSSLNIIIHGTGEPGAIINGTIDNTSFTSNILENGEWCYTLQNPLKDNTNYNLSITQKSINGEISPATSAEFRTDTKTFVAHTVTRPASNQSINTKTPVLSGTGKKGATIEASIFGCIYNTVVNQDGFWNIITSKALNDGLNTFDVIQKDMGNLYSSVTLSFIVDTIAPQEPNIENPINMGFEKNSKPSVSGRSEANATINAVVDNKEYTAIANVNGTWNFEISEELTNDTHIISAKQKDAAGNISAEKISLFSVDTIQPIAPVILKPSNGDCLSTPTPVLKGNGEKGSRIEIRLENKVYSTLIGEDGLWESTVSDSLSDGAYTFKACQIDKAGNVSPYTSLTVKIDTSIPLAPVILFPINDSYINSTNFNVKGTGEPDSIIECTIAGIKYHTNVGINGIWSIQIVGNNNLINSQQYSIMANQSDSAGNLSPVMRVKFKIDTECLKAPQITFPLNNSYISTVNPTITGKGKPGATVNISINNMRCVAEVTNDGSWSAIIGTSLQQGNNTINIYQADYGNDSAVSSITFNVDTISPIAPQINFPEENQNVDSSNLIVKGNGEDKATINIKLDDKCYTTTAKQDCTWEMAIPEKLANGLHAIMASQSDIAGNASAFTTINFVSTSAQLAYSTDENPVVCEILYNPPAPNWAAKVIAVLKTNKPVTVNNIYGNIFSKIITSNGINTFDYKDQEGNSSSATAGITWIDNKLPTIQVNNNSNYFSSDKTVTYFKTNGSEIKYALLNGVPFESGKIVTQDSFYRVEVSDQIGNIATEEFLVDKTPPIISGVENNMVYKTDVKINFSDNLSGVKSALLNGQNVSSGTVLKANGDYKITVTNFGDLISELNFKIQK
jgi:hypothetical protein